MKSKLKLIVGICFALQSGCREEEVPAGYYVFQPNAYYMIADGEKTLYLDVFKNRYDESYVFNDDESYLFEKISDKAVFFHNGTALSDNTFTTTAIGEHKFSARIGNWTSDEITVIARADDKDYEVITIPLIFHILYNDEPVGTGANINKEDVEEVVNIINQRYRNTYYSINYPNVIPSPNHVDTKIEFRLAKFDPQGNLLEEPGIMRYGGYDATTWTDIDPQRIFLTENLWPPYDYINISLANQNMRSEATMPVASSSHKFCGLEVNDETWEEYFARNYKSGENIVFKGMNWSLYNFYGGLALTHDLGHILGLHHTFFTECNFYRFPFGQDDCVGDTQFYNENQFQTDFYGKKHYKECYTDYWVVHDNYMDYSRKITSPRFEDYYGFTYDQRDRMQEILEFSPWIKELKNSDK